MCLPPPQRLYAVVFSSSDGDVFKVKAWSPGNGSLRGKRQVALALPLPAPHHAAALPFLFDGHNLHLPASGRLLQPGPHLLQDIDLVEPQLPLKDHILRLARQQPLLQPLHERHRLLHLPHLRHFRPERLVVHEQGDAVEAGADELDVFFLPCGIRRRGENGESFGELGVEGDRLAFFFLL